MGLINTKLFKRRDRLMIDKTNFTSQCSLETSFSSSSSQGSLSGFVSTIEDVDNYEFDSIMPMYKATSKDFSKLKSEIRVDTISSGSDISRSKREICTDMQRKLDKVYLKHQIEKLGINEISSSTRPKPFFSGIIYLPECDLVICHYLALYRLKLDTLSQYDFKGWCLKMGHTETSKKYSILVTVYASMKQKHFADSYIINRIVSRQNVYLKISDLFGEDDNHLRAFIVVGDRRSIVQSVIDSYCFAVKGHISFIIKSADEYKKYAKTSLNLINRLTTDNWDFFNSFSRNNYRGVQPRTSKEALCTLGNAHSNVIEVLNIHPNSITDLTMNSRSNQGQVSLSNYMRFQSKTDNVNYICHNSPIYSEGNAYNLVSIVADKTYAYILCRNTNCNDYDLSNISLPKEDELSNSQYGINQSNSFSRVEALKKILRTEIIECCNKRNYGVSLSKIPCGQLYVVSCSINNRLPETDAELNEILARHIICGKVINKEYNLDLQMEEKFIIHLHGNKQSVLNCCKELKDKSLATHIQLVRPFFDNERALKQPHSIIF